MTIGVAELHVAAVTASAAFAVSEQSLNAADARLGDGDTGSMLRRLSAAVAATDTTPSTLPAAAFRTMAMAASSSTGSSLSTLVMTALMSFAQGSSGKATIETAELAPMLNAAVEAMLKRGGAKAGDKTVIDSLLAVSAALRVGGSPRQAARDVLDRFRGEPNRIGRAGRYGEQSRGLDDPGMLAIQVLCDALEPKGQ